MANPFLAGRDSVGSNPAAQTVFARQEAGSTTEDYELEPASRPPARSSDPTTPPPPPSSSGRPPRAVGRSARAWFWPGFVVGFLLLFVLSLGGAALLVGITPLTFSEMQSQSGVWTPPPVPPTPEVAEQVAAEAESGAAEIPVGFAIGDAMRNITQSRVNIRQVPGYLSKPAGDVIAQIGPGESVELLGGRAVADNLNWWYIRYRTPGNQVVDGWIADATASGVQILGR